MIKIEGNFPLADRRNILIFLIIESKLKHWIFSPLPNLINPSNIYSWGIASKLTIEVVHVHVTWIRWLHWWTEQFWEFFIIIGVNDVETTGTNQVKLLKENVCRKRDRHTKVNSSSYFSVVKLTSRHGMPYILTSSLPIM